MADSETPQGYSETAHEDRWRRAGDAVSLKRARKGGRTIRFAAEPDEVEIDLGATALLVIDMQNDFLHPEGWFASTRGADVAPLNAPVAAINRLAAALRRENVPVIHVNWGVRPDRANLPANVLDRASDCGSRPGYGDPLPRGAVLVSGSWGAASVDAIDVAATDFRVDKHRFSGFRDNELDQMLRRLGATTLLYAGVNVDRCVFATLMDGAFNGYDGILLTDATATASPAYVGDAVLYLVRLLYGFTATTADVLAAIGAASSSPTSNGDLP